MLTHLDATGKTVTCTVSLAGGATSALTVSESSGVYSATFVNAGTGLLHVWWQNTTDSTEERQTYYWDGTTHHLSVPPLIAQQVRDAMKLTHTDGDISVDVMLQNIETEVL